MNFSSLGAILFNIIAPIVLIAAAGYVLGRTREVDGRSLSRASLYIFSPALIFTSAYRSKLGSEFVTLTVFAVVITLLMGIIVLALVKLFRYDRLTASGFALSVLFLNSGNYGLPLMLFAFGEEGLARAVIFFTATSVIIHTLAVFIAARGKAHARDALLNVFKLPLFYAVILGLVFNQACVVVPEMLMKAIQLTGDAAVPVMLIILGLELARTKINSDHSVIAVATFAKLIIMPIVAFALARVMGLTGLMLAVCVMQSSMPTAVFASILAVEFDARPDLVAGTVFFSTVGSVLTLTILLAILM